MPFVTLEHRKNPDMDIPGDRCYTYYARMMKQWRNDRRWTTADDIYRWVKILEDRAEDQRAKELAWQVFFVMHVMIYEEEKQEENGDI